MNWDLNEIRNQLIHIFIGFWVAYIFIRLFPKYNKYLVIFFSTLLCGTMIECYQYFIKVEELKIDDRIRDVIFYILGGMCAI